MIFGWCPRRRFAIYVAAVAMLLAARTGRAQPSAPQLAVTSAVADANGALTISGQNFAAASGRFGTRPFVTLDLVPLDVRVATDTAILATVPSGSIPPATYLLTVSRGPAAAENASLEVTVGAANGTPVPANLPPPAASVPSAGSTASAASLPPIVSGTTPAA